MVWVSGIWSSEEWGSYSPTVLQFPILNSLAPSFLPRLHLQSLSRPVRKRLTAPSFHGVWQTLARSECSQLPQMRPFLLLAMPFMILETPKSLGIVCIASLSCLLLRSLYFFGYSRWASSPFIGPRGSSRGDRQKMKFLSVVLHIYLNCTAVLELLCCMEFVLPQISYMVLVALFFVWYYLSCFFKMRRSCF